MRTLRHSLTIAVLLAAQSGATRAQAPRGSATLDPSAVAESLIVLDELNAALRRDSEDASTWYRRGMIAWALAERDRHTPRIGGLDRTSLGRMADTSLRIAAAIDKRNAMYRLMAGRYLLSTETSLSRAASYGMFEDALTAARLNDNEYVHSEAAVEAGRVYWRRYDALANRWTQIENNIACEPITASLGRNEVANLIDQLNQCALPVEKPPSGEDDYLRAEELFREAFNAQPSNQRAYQQLAMLLVDRNRWTELAALARARTTAAPWDAWAWLTTALAMYRQRADVRSVVAAFDTAFRLLPEAEARRFHRFERVLRPEDTAKVQSATDAERFAYHRLFWTSANPLWSRDIAQPQLDYLSRVVYAELRWTVEELGVRGADTDRGDVYIRYGPPDLMYARRPPSAVSPILSTWIYRRGLVFSFTGQPTFATARVPPSDEAAFGDIIKTSPMLWEATASVTIDTMPSQLARFRARGDSVDILFAAAPPVARIQSSAEVRNQATLHYWLLAGGTVLLAHDSAFARPNEIVSFTHRVRPKAFSFRTEASSVGSSYAARAAAAFGADSANGFPARGFGMSDVLVASSITEKQSQTVIRWNDYDIQPLGGVVGRGASISLLWEMYDLAQRDRGVEYDVTVILERDQSTTGRVAARLLGRFGQAVGIAQTDERVALTFERRIPFRSFLVDNVAMRLEDTAPGYYKLTVRIDDKVSGKSMARTTSFLVQ